MRDLVTWFLDSFCGHFRLFVCWPLFASVYALLAPLIFDLEWDFVLVSNSVSVRNFARSRKMMFNFFGQF